MLATDIGVTGRSSYAQELHRIAQAAEALGGSAHAQAVNDLSLLLKDDSLRVVVFGEFSVGKSTLLNALFGRVALPAKALPTTGHTTRIGYGQTEGVRVVLADGRSEGCPLDEIASFVTLDLQSRARDGIERIEVTLNDPLLQGGLTLIDTPGVNDADTQTQRAERAVMGADLVLLVLRASQMLGGEVRHAAGAWMARELGKPVVPVLNGMNQVEEEADRRELGRLLEAWSRSTLTPVLGKPYFEVNALGALRHTLGMDGATMPDDDFAALRAALRGLSGGAGRELQSASRAAQARAVLRRAASWNGAELAQLRGAADTLRRGRAARLSKLRHALNGLRRRLDAEDTHVRAQAGEALAEGWTRLERRLDSKSKERLEASASDWFDTYISEAAENAERHADERLASLADEVGTAAPEPLTVMELVQLTQRTAVEITVHDNTGAVGKGGLSGALAGAALGSFIPVIGTFVGGLIGFFGGSYLADRATVREPDYAAAYTEAARTDWDSLAPTLEEAIAVQFNDRLATLLASLQREADDLAKAPAGEGEIQARETLQGMLERAQQPRRLR